MQEKCILLSIVLYTVQTFLQTVSACQVVVVDIPYKGDTNSHKYTLVQ